MTNRAGINGYTPSDYLSPDWSRAERVHNWRNHVSDEVQGMWQTFTEAQRAALARQAEYAASCEEWD